MYVKKWHSQLNWKYVVEYQLSWKEQVFWHTLYSASHQHVHCNLCSFLAHGEIYSFSLRFHFFVLLRDGFHYGNPSSLRLLKGIPRGQKRARAITTTRKQSMSTGWPLAAQKVV